LLTGCHAALISSRFVRHGKSAVAGRNDQPRSRAGPRMLGFREGLDPAMPPLRRHASGPPRRQWTPIALCSSPRFDRSCGRKPAEAGAPNRVGRPWKALVVPPRAGRRQNGEPAHDNGSNSHFARFAALGVHPSGCLSPANTL